MSASSSLAGQVALVTGAARGQGRSHALALAERGADVIALDVCRDSPTTPYRLATAADLAATVADVQSCGRRAIGCQVDVTDLASLTAAVDTAVADLGRLDIVIANAGISSVPAPSLTMDETVWTEQIEVNLTGVWKTMRAAVPHVQAGGRGGSVVITSSVAAFLAHANSAHYSAAKAGLIGLMQVTAKELAPDRIRVNTVHPTVVATDMVLNPVTYRLFAPHEREATRAAFEAASRGLNRLPVSMLESRDVTAAVLYLVEESGRYVTGTTLTVDAGGRL